MRACATAPFAVGHASAGDARWRPHDLLRLRSLPVFDGEPPWVRDAFARAPFAVVRRAPSAEGLVAVGMRGAGRAQRYGVWADIADIDAVFSPEALGRSTESASGGTHGAFPAFAVLAALRDDPANPINAYDWGPTGSVGFELASRMPTVTASSDLDLLIRTPSPLARDVALAWFNHLQTVAQAHHVRIDAQLETPAGGVALAEWAAEKSRVLARHASGQQLIANPWVSLRNEDT